MRTVLIVGANRGLGLEFARQYLDEGAEVHAVVRKASAADALQALADKGSLTIHQGDVADGASMAVLAAAIDGRPIDVAIANAGIYGGPHQSWHDMDYDAFAHTLAVNAMGPLRVAQVAHASLKAGREKKFVAITSQMGSNAGSGGGMLAYRSSKAALNKLMSSLALDWKADGISVIPMHPGWVRTDMGGPNATLSPEESVAGMRKVIDGLSLESSGRFFNHDGSQIPW